MFKNCKRLFYLLFISLNFCFNDLKSVYVIRYGSNLFHSERVSTIRKEKFVNFSWLVYYLEDTQGHRILIDTGIENEFHASLYGISNLVTPSSTLKSNQISPNSITDIFITHWHLDHIGGISQYPNANIFVQKLEYNWILKNPNYTFFKNFFLQKEKQKKLFLVKEELQIYEIFFLKWTGGHTVGSLSVLVNVPKMQIVFTGDECYFREECKQKIPLPRSAVYSYSKNKIFLESVQENWLIFTMHDPSIPGATNSNFLRLY